MSDCSSKCYVYLYNKHIFNVQMQLLSYTYSTSHVNTHTHDAYSSAAINDFNIEDISYGKC